MFECRFLVDLFPYPLIFLLLIRFVLLVFCFGWLLEGSVKSFRNGREVLPMCLVQKFPF